MEVGIRVALDPDTAVILAGAGRRSFGLLCVTAVIGVSPQDRPDLCDGTPPRAVTDGRSEANGQYATTLFITGVGGVVTGGAVVRWRPVRRGPGAGGDVAVSHPADVGAVRRGPG